MVAGSGYVVSRSVAATVESPLENGHTLGERLLTAGYVIGGVVRDQWTVPGRPDGRGGRDGRPGVRTASQDVRVEQLVQLVPNVRVHPSVDDRVGHGGRHGGKVANGQRHVKLFGVHRRHQVSGQREHRQRQPAYREHDRDA